MTMREYHNAIIEANLSDELTEVAKKEIAKLDKRNATPSKAEKEKAEQNERIKAQMVGILKASEVPMVAADVAAAIEISTQKASSLLRQLVADGVANQTEVKVKGKGKVKGYALAVAEAE